jgi:hypothetical protein
MIAMLGVAKHWPHPDATRLPRPCVAGAGGLQHDVRCGDLYDRLAHDFGAGYVAPGDKWDNTGGTDVCDFGRSRRTGVMSMCTSRRRTRVGPYFGRVSSC